MLWACLLLPHLALDDVQRRSADTTAALVIADGPAQRRIVRDANVAALRAGIHVGQPLAAARAVLPEFRCIAYDAAAETRLRDLLAAWAYGYSSMVSLREHDAILVEIGASLNLFGPWPNLERRLRSELIELGITHRIAIAPTALGACVLATSQDGIAVMQSGPFKGALAHIALSAARLPDENVSALHAMGIRRLRELFALPRSGVAKRFTPALLDHLDRLRGDAPDPLPLHHPPACFFTRMEFDHAIESSEILLFPLRRLLSDFSVYLQGRDSGVQQFQILLDHDDLPSSLLTVGLQSPQRHANALMEVARLMIQRMTVPAAVRALSIRAEELPAYVPDAEDLFDDRSSGSQLSWSQLADRLRARLGQEQVYQLTATHDPRPEYAWRRAAFSQRTAMTIPRDGTRPTWLFPWPLPLHGQPQHILAGPERIESGWWEGLQQDVRRDYYVIETRLGQRAWAFRLLDDAGPWMLHGWFA
ncbi:DNA polymerase Y family protein [Pseudolysobacter antarcticus]|uniref:DNA polymerase Y family protein n=1 Tax=Pseudolysobacter antarcticus TaxID=2511995 RepID=A0A411HJV4_9GAMM|nr:DNA polymerase Y family protein [Pseudolysobacter antarcticus]QBB70680.1 DNA polymerase Y family protein [Pseudolysobacter antarcticus]